MTAIFSARRKTFAMLAADNLSRSRNDFGFDTRRFHRKLTVHPNLPIAFASSGLSHLNGTLTIERAIGALDGLPASPLNLDIVRQRLREGLQQLVIEQLEHVPPQLQDIDHCVHLHLAIFGANGPECGGLYMTKTAEDREGGYLQMPDPLHSWFKEHQDIDWEGVNLTSAAELSIRVRDTFTTVFQRDALLHDGVSLSVGGAIDIATVDADGATLFSMLPVEWPCSVLDLPIPRRVKQMYSARGWSLEEMTDAIQPNPPVQRDDDLRRVRLNPLLEDRLLVKYAVHELASVALNHAWAVDQLPIAAASEQDVWQETLCHEICAALDITEYPFGQRLDQVPPEVAVIAQELVGHA
jgi:hypothetical protein